MMVSLIVKAHGYLRLNKVGVLIVSTSRDVQLALIVMGEVAATATMPSLLNVIISFVSSFSKSKMHLERGS